MDGYFITTSNIIKQLVSLIHCNAQMYQVWLYTDIFTITGEDDRLTHLLMK